MIDASLLIGLAIVMLAGPGPWSVDAALHARRPA
jgi:hypothetical protein